MSRISTFASLNRKNKLLNANARLHQFFLPFRERDRDRQRQRDRERHRETDRQTERERERDAQ